MAINYGMFTDTFQNTEFVGIPSAIGLIVVIITLFLITRDPHKMKILAFPITIGWSIVGVTQSFILLIATGLIFLQASLTFNIIGALSTAVTGDEPFHKALKHGYRKTVRTGLDKSSNLWEHLKSPRPEFPTQEGYTIIKGTSDRSKQSMRERLLELLRRKKTPEGGIHTFGEKGYPYKKF